MRSHFAGCADLNFRLQGGVGRSVLVRYDQQLVEGFWLVAEELVLEKGAFSAPGGEVLDSLHLVHALVGVPELAPAREVFTSLDSLGPCTHKESWRGLRGRLYVLVKLRTKALVKSTQLLMLRGFRLFSHVRAVPWSMRGTYFTATHL